MTKRLTSDRVLSPAARHRQHDCAALTAAVFACAFAGNVRADHYLEVLGGPGGGQFHERCGELELLRGFELRVGDDVDALRPLCVTAYEPSEVSAAFESRWHGGTGGSLNRDAICPDDKPIVIEMDVDAEGVDTIIVNTIVLHCGVASSIQAAGIPGYFDAGFIGPRYMPSATRIGFGFGFEGAWASGTHGSQRCPAGEVAVGVHGRSGIWLDAVGLICGEPQLMPRGPVPMPPPKKKTIAERLTKTTMAQSSVTTTALVGSSRSTTKATGLGAYGVISGQTPSPAPPPAVAPVPAPALPLIFEPPLLEDNAQLWACAGAAAGEAEAGACSGAESAQAYCHLRDAHAAPDVLVAVAQPEIPVRAVNGDVCLDADACRVVSKLQCDH